MPVSSTHLAHYDIAAAAPWQMAASRAALNARKPGTAAAIEESIKRRRYGNKVLLVVWETLGRPGQSAQEFLRSLVREHLPADRGDLLAGWWAAAGATLAGANARMVASAVGAAATS